MIFSSSNLHAATYSWSDTITGSNLTGNWSAGAGWNAVPVSAADTTLTFGYTAWTTNSTAKTTTLTNNVANPFLLNVLTFGGVNPTAGSGTNVALVNIAGSPLSLVSNDTATPVINLNSNRSNGQVVTYNVQSDVTLGSGTAFTGNGTANFIFSGKISGTSGFTKSGSSTLTLSNGSNDITGGVTLSGGGLALGSTTALGNNTISVTGNSTISATSGTISNTINITNGVTLGLRNIGGNNTTTTFSSAITGNVGITLVQGTGNTNQTVELSSTSNNFTGNLTLPTGTGNNDFISFNSIGDAGSIVYGRSSWRSVATYNGSTNLNLNTRSISLANTFGGLGTSPGLDGNGNPINMFANSGTGVVTIGSDMVSASSANNGVFYFGGSNTGNNTFSGLIADNPGAGTLGIGKWDAGKWVLSNSNNSFNGNVYIANGTLSVANIQALGNGSVIQLGYGNNTGTLEYTGSSNASTGKQVVVGNLTNNGHTGGATILNNGTGTLSFTNATFNTLTVPWTGSLTVTTVDRTLTLGGTNTGANTIEGTIQDNVSGAAQVSLSKTGAGTWVLSGTNTYTGATTISAGVLEAVSGTGLPTASTLQLRGGVFQSSGTFTRAVSTATGAVNWSTSSGGFAARGGDLILNLNGGTASLTWNGSSMVSTGQTLIFGSTTADSLVDWQNGLNLGSSSSGQRTIHVVDNPNSTTDIARISGQITNSAAGWGIEKTGAGTLQLTNGSNSYSGGTSINAGTVSFANGALGTTGNITFTGNSTLQWNGSNTQDISARLVMTNGVTSAFDTNGNNVTLASGFGSNSSGALTKIGTGTLTLTGTNNYTGATTISSGTLQIGDGGTTGSIASTSGVTNNGTLVYNRSNDLTAAYAIDGNGSLTKQGAGVLTLTINNGYIGATTISSGTLQIGDGGTTGSIASTSGVTNNGALVYNRSNDLTAAYEIDGNGSLTKQGAGTLTLTGNSNYTGITQVDGGTLMVNGSLGNTAVTVTSAGTLSGTGIIGGPVAVNGTISPGNSPGYMTTGSESWNGGGSYLWEVNAVDTSSVLQTLYQGLDLGHDWLKIIGSLDVNSTLSNLFSIDITGLNSSNEAGAVTNWNSSKNYAWVIASADSINGFDASKFFVDATAFANNNNIGGGTFALVQGGSILGTTGNDLVLTFTAAIAPVPELGTLCGWSTICLCVGIFTWRRRSLQTA